MQNGLVHVLFDGFMHVSRPEGRYQIDPEGFVLWVDPPKRSDEEIISTAEEAYLADGNPALETTDRNERCEALALAGYLDVNAWFLRNTVKLGIRITEKGKQSNVV
jgi:hypothetical protein